ILACFQRSFLEIPSPPSYQAQILFYIDATSGRLYSQYDMDKYFELYQLPKKDVYFKPLSHQLIISNMASELGKCYLSSRELQRKQDLDQISTLLLLTEK